MKSRIVENLAGFACPQCPEKNRPMFEMVQKELGLTSGEIRERAARILKSLIHNYAAFEVSTIDGFTHRVLRTFAKDLDLPLNFEVELNTTEVLQEAVDQLVARAGTDPELTQILVSFSLGKTDEDKSWDVSRDLLEIAELLTRETNQPFLELLKDKELSDFQRLDHTLKKEIAKLKGQATEAAESFFSLLEAHAVEDSDFSGGYCPKFFHKILRGQPDSDFDKVWQSKLEDQPLYPKKVPASKQQVMDQLQPQIWSLFSGVKEALLQIQFMEAVQKNLVPLSLLSAIQNEIELFKRSRNIVLISEFNAQIAATIRDQPAPFIYERLGERYRHYFIDEFQDTSELQWKNLIPLIDHALSSEPDPEANSLTIVGDAKQSIYRWRGGKAEQFMQLCTDYNPFSVEDKKVVQLPVNFRSTREVVEFNNQFFTFSSRYFQDQEHRTLFEETSRQQPKSPGGGYVKIELLQADQEEEINKLYVEKVLKTIRSIQDRNISLGEVCILTRTLKEGVLVATHLSEHGVPVISQESLLLSGSPRVQFVLSVLRFALDGSVKQVKWEILQYLADHQLNLAESHEFIRDRLELNDQQFLDSLQTFGYKLNLEDLTVSTLYEAVETVIRCFNLIEGSDAYLQFFLDFVYETTQTNMGIFSFLELWERKKDKLSISAPENPDAVEIMTIHKAKGLEFEIVIYPFAHSKIGDVSRESLWLPLPEPLNQDIPVGHIRASKKMTSWGSLPADLYNILCGQSQLDALNVLYVALTRPVQELYVITKMDTPKKDQEPKNYAQLLSSYLQDAGIWREDQTIYEFGSTTSYQVKQVEKQDVQVPQRFFSSPTQAGGVSIITRSGMLWDSRQEKALERGRLVHELFARVNTADDIDAVLEEAIGEGLLTYDQQKEIATVLQEVVHHPQLKDFYTGQTMNFTEKDMISREGTLLRPDRLCFDGNQVSLVDYKTGEERKEHQTQIKVYSQVLEEMGYDIKDRLLVYLNDTVQVSRI